MIPISRPFLGRDEIEAVKRILDSGNLVMGRVTEELEEAFSRYVGTEHAVATSSGTTALQVGLEALDINKGSEVITTPFSFIASSNTLLFNYLKPVFADIDVDSFNIDPEEIEERMEEIIKEVKKIHSYETPAIDFLDIAGGSREFLEWIGKETEEVKE